MYHKYRVWDPLYGRIDLTEYEYQLLSLPEVQRLRDIRMCNINSLLITGASQISRFEHTIGVLRLVKEWIKYNPLGDTDEKLLKAAAILHDMQTGPFGHSLQYIFEDNSIDEFIHQDILNGIKNSYHQDLLQRISYSGRVFESKNIIGTQWDDVAELIKGENKYGALISGTMDLDNIDNVIRLAYHVGVADKKDIKIALELVADISISNKEIIISKSSIKRVKRWQKIRENLYNLLLLDWAEFSAKAMLTRAMELAIEHKVIGADSWIYTDSQLLNILEEVKGDLQEVSNLIKRIKVADLYEPLFMFKSSSIDAYSKVSDKISKFEIEERINALLKNNNIISGKVLVHFILDNKKTKRSVTVRVRDNNFLKKKIGEDSKVLLIGIFIPKPKNIKPDALVIIYDEVLKVLKNNGIFDIKMINDPIDQDDSYLEKQMILL